ncbi:hypothetical protein RAS_p440 (plasmid) [Rickettsia asiatica]|uniref:Uncharacterized protein n=1 Tax=Rickettsia asiatica TaxID=238800 RepID=A0A510G947_9RICK|nr:hypothetical protein RAS_p440 [Rickettsia asiatica]
MFLPKFLIDSNNADLFSDFPPILVSLTKLGIAGSTGGIGGAGGGDCGMIGGEDTLVLIPAESLPNRKL